MAEVTYYFKSYNWGWDTSPLQMVDNNLATFASTDTDGQYEEVDANTCPGSDLGTISKVELRCYGNGDGNDRIDIIPYFGGTLLGDVHQTTPGTSAAWGPYVDITNDTNAPSPWAWSDITDLDARITKENVGKGNTMYCAKVEIRVTYTTGAVETIVAQEFPMGYYQTTGVKELRSKVSGATITKIANDFPPILQKEGKAEELVSKWS